MSKSFFDLLGIDNDAFKKLSDISLKDYIKTNESITGAFNELSDDKKKKVVESMNKIQKTFSDLFGTKVEEFTENDFNGSTVNVSTKVYDSSKNSDETDTNKEDNVEVSDNFVDKFDKEKCKTCECYDDCLSSYKDEVCDSQEDCNTCEFFNDCDCEEDYDDEEYTLCDELLEELESEDTNDEEIVDSIVEYVLATLSEKKNKKYILHPAANMVPPAVEVKIPEEIATISIFDNMHIMTLLREVLMDTTGAHDAYINRGEGKTIVVYIPLKKANN